MKTIAWPDVSWKIDDSKYYVIVDQGEEHCGTPCPITIACSPSPQTWGPKTAKRIAAAPALAKQLAKMVEYLEEAHSEEIRKRHFGDGRKGCSYCDAIRDAKKLLRSLQ